MLQQLNFFFSPTYQIKIPQILDQKERWVNFIVINTIFSKKRLGTVMLSLLLLKMYENPESLNALMTEIY